MGHFFCSRVSSQPRDQTVFPVSSGLQADSLPLSHKGSPANSGFNYMLLEKIQIDSISVFVIQRIRTADGVANSQEKFLETNTI